VAAAVAGEVGSELPFCVRKKNIDGISTSLPFFLKDNYRAD
jgi:hypothetical protein